LEKLTILRHFRHFNCWLGWRKFVKISQSDERGLDTDQDLHFRIVGQLINCPTVY
jgi:hypothetical protein